MAKPLPQSLSRSAEATVIAFALVMAIITISKAVIGATDKREQVFELKRRLKVALTTLVHFGLNQLNTQVLQSSKAARMAQWMSNGLAVTFDVSRLHPVSGGSLKLPTRGKLQTSVSSWEEKESKCLLAVLPLSFHLQLLLASLDTKKDINTNWWPDWIKWLAIRPARSLLRAERRGAS